VGFTSGIFHFAAEIETQTGRKCDSNPENGFDQNTYWPRVSCHLEALA
jgi:hypothetical protein